MSPQIDSFNDVQCEEVYRDTVFGDVSFADNYGMVWDIVGVSKYIPPCMVDRFGNWEFNECDIEFVANLHSRCGKENWVSDGYYKTLSDLLLSGF